MKSSPRLMDNVFSCKFRLFILNGKVFSAGYAF